MKISKIKNSWIINTISRVDSLYDYLKWFSNSTDIKENISDRFSDFFGRILTPDMYKYLGNSPFTQTCCEIGSNLNRFINME